jgi:ATP-binding protein involved in chromosome partitioning
MTTIDDIRERLSEIRPHGAPGNIIALGMVRGVDTQDGTVIIHFAPPAMPPPLLDATIADMRRAVGALDGVRQVEVRITPPSSHAGHTPTTGSASAGGPAARTPTAGEPTGGPPGAGAAGLPGVRDIIAVASTKGGVGKSTVAANLALALVRLGQRVGLLDADVYGPSLPILFGAAGRPQVTDTKRIVPLERYGLRLMSIGFFLDESSPVIWRGPLVMGLVRQFLKDVEWGELDILVVDMPPGTGDAQLTLVQQVPLAGTIVVTTPQEVATLDVQRGIAMFEQVKTPVLGIIENMSFYECPRCGTHDAVFGSGGGARIAQQFGVPLLGAIPLVPEIRAGGDAGTPIVIDRPEHAVSRSFVRIAQSVLEALAAERLGAPPPTIIG